MFWSTCLPCIGVKWFKKTPTKQLSMPVSSCVKNPAHRDVLSQDLKKSHDQMWLEIFLYLILISSVSSFSFLNTHKMASFIRDGSEMSVTRTNNLLLLRTVVTVQLLPSVMTEQSPWRHVSHHTTPSVNLATTWMYFSTLTPPRFLSKHMLLHRLIENIKSRPYFLPFYYNAPVQLCEIQGRS